jgi:hypothetical protein
MLMNAQSLSPVSELPEEGNALPLAWMEVAAVVAKIQCMLLARAVPSGAGVIVEVQSAWRWHGGNPTARARKCLAAVH